MTSTCVVAMTASLYDIMYLFCPITYDIQEKSGFCINLIKKEYEDLEGNFILRYWRIFVEVSSALRNRVRYVGMQLDSMNKRGSTFFKNHYISTRCVLLAYEWRLLAKCPNQSKLPIGNSTWMSTSWLPNTNPNMITRSHLEWQDIIIHPGFELKRTD